MELVFGVLKLYISAGSVWAFPSQIAAVAFRFSAVSVHQFLELLSGSVSSSVVVSLIRVLVMHLSHK